MKYIICVLVLLCPYLSSAQDFVLDDMKRSLPCVEKELNVRVIMSVDSTFRLPHLSQHEVDSIFTELNKYFAPICMSFTSCDYCAVLACMQALIVISRREYL